MGLASTDWLMALGWRQGLFAHCIEEGAPTPLPFNMVDPAGCYQARDVGEDLYSLKGDEFLIVRKILSNAISNNFVISQHTSEQRLRYASFAFWPILRRLF